MPKQILAFLAACLTPPESRYDSDSDEASEVGAGLVFKSFEPKQLADQHG